MTERDYIIATELTRLRCADGILSRVVAENVATVTGVDPATAVAEYRHLMTCLDTWVARLERLLDKDPRDKDAHRREWPCVLTPADAGTGER